MLQQNYDGCKNPFVVYGPELTILSWNKKDNTLSMSSSVNATNVEWCYSDSNYEDALTIHPYSQPDQCLAAPLKEGDPVSVINCVVESQEQLMGISWTLYVGS
nr:1448_t:CDS:2 [Entrophospora candida]CAG8437540.1 3945_t:CDS:2 [Entrophospora candida]